MNKKMKVIKLQGKDYVQVVERLKYFRSNHEDGRIETTYEIIGSSAFFSAKIYIGDTLKATGHARKDIKAEFNLEKCETRAIGRALGIFGIGADNSISSYEEVREATATPNVTQEVIEPPAPIVENLKWTEEKLANYEAATSRAQTEDQWKELGNWLVKHDAPEAVKKQYKAEFAMWQNIQEEK